MEPIPAKSGQPSDREPARVTSGRIETALNSRLSEVIPVIYGAVVSYGMWVLARLLVRFQANYSAPSGEVPLDFRAFACAIVLFGCITVFLLQEVGEITKYNADFPMRRTSRYSHEIIIASLYLCAYALLERGVLLAWIAFAWAIGFGGVWFNQLKEEYPTSSKLVGHCETMRALHYIGAWVFTAEAAAFLIARESVALDFGILACFFASFLLWLVVYVAAPALRHGVAYNDYLVNIVFPDSWVTNLQKRQDGNYKEA